MKKLHTIFLFLTLILGVISQLEAASAAASSAAEEAGGSGSPPAKRPRAEGSGEGGAAAVSKSLVFANPTFDTSFKQIFRADEGAGVSRETQYDVLSSFISAFLGRTVTIVKAITEFVPPLREGKESQRAMDVVCEGSDGTRYNIEMQQAYQGHWDARALYYLSALYHQQINSAAYSTLQPVIGISILGHDRPDFEDYKRHFKFIDVSPHSMSGVGAGAGAGASSSSSSAYAPKPTAALDKMELVEVSLSRALIYPASNALEAQWLLLFNKAAHLTEIPAEITDVTVRKAFERLRYETWGDTVRAAYSKEQADTLAVEARIEAARAESVAENRKDIALKGLKKSWSLGTLMEITSLSEIEIRKIAEENGIEIK